MISRRHDLQTRLIRAYTLLLGSLLLLFWVSGLIYFFEWERADIRQATQTAASMLATQSSAALMFGDQEVLRENLATIRNIEGFRWAAIVPTNVEIPLPVISYGAEPGDVMSILQRMGDRTDRVSLQELLVRAPIVHRDEVRGQVMLSVDLRGEITGFLRVMATTLLLLAVGFGLGRWLFQRIVHSIVAPLDQLIRLTTDVASKAKEDAALEDLPRPSADYADEVGKLGDAFNKMLDSIIRHDAQMRDQADRLVQLVEDLRSLSARMRAIREEERTRISHEIHDELGQRLTSLKYDIARLLSDDGAGQLSAQVDDLIRTVRVISWELRPSVLDSLGLVAAIEWQAQDFSRRIGIRCSVDLPEEEPKLPKEMATDLFRVFQELLTNVSRHARAGRVDAILELTESTLHMEVKDDGCGIRLLDQSRPSLGLLGIRERLERWGGVIDIGPVNPDAENAGTRIRIEIPLGTVITRLESVQ